MLTGDGPKEDPLLEFSHTSKPFTFKVKRTADPAATIFDTTDQRLVFKVGSFPRQSNFQPPEIRI